MIAVDTNILVYAHRRDSRWHQRARECLGELAEGRRAWLIAWPSLHEFVGVVTHPRIYAPPSSLVEALTQIDNWMQSPTLTVVAESADYWKTLRFVLLESKIVGPQIHDARIAAMCLEQGVDELWTADRDFSRFPKLRTRNPLPAA